MEVVTVEHVEEGGTTAAFASSPAGFQDGGSRTTPNPIFSMLESVNDGIIVPANDKKYVSKTELPGLLVNEDAADFGIQPNTVAMEAGKYAAQKDQITGTEANLIETGTSTAVMEFSVLDVITFSATVTKECVAVLTDPDRTVWAKLWATFRIVNNFMNREAFFYVDLIICVGFSIYNATVTKPMKAFTFYVDGALVINVIFLWYFCYCRYLNGKDVITLRRSIQLLSHSFQISLVGLLVLCNEHHDVIVDDNHSHHHYHHVTFHCTGTFLASNTLRILWHVTVLIKSVLDEYFGSFLITRGVAVDFLTILLSPLLIIISLFTDLFAVDVRRYLISKLSVTYEVNDITSNTKFYQSLTDSKHRTMIESITLFLILEVAGLGEFVDNYVDGAPYYEYQYETCLYYIEIMEPVAIYVMLVLSAVGWGLMSEFYFCKQLKLSTLFMFLIVNFCCRLGLCILCSQRLLCLVNSHDDEEGNHDDASSFYRRESVVTELWYLSFLLLTIISGGVLATFMWDNAEMLKRQHIWVFVDYFKFVCFVLVYSPLVPMYYYFVVPVASVGTSVVKSVSKQFSFAISLQSFAANTMATPESEGNNSLRDAGELPTEGTALSLSDEGPRYICRLILTWVVALPLLPVALITEVCLGDIQSFFGVHANKTDIIYEGFQRALRKRKLLPMYFFQILAALNLIDEAKIRLSASSRYSEEGQFVCLTKLVPVGYAVVGIGSALMVEYFLFKEVKFCAAFVFSVANFTAHLYAVIVLRSYYAPGGRFHSGDDLYSNGTFDDYTTQSSSVAQMPYDRLIVGLALATAVTALYCYDNFAIIKERQIWVLADYFKLLLFIFVRYPLSVVQRAFCASAMLSYISQRVPQVLYSHHARKSQSLEPTATSVRESPGCDLRSPFVDL
jgi:hypothetical protein